MITNTEITKIQKLKYEYRSTNVKIQIEKYKKENVGSLSAEVLLHGRARARKTEKQIEKSKSRNTNTKVQIQKYKYRNIKSQMLDLCQVRCCYTVVPEQGMRPFPRFHDSTQPPQLGYWSALSKY